MGSTAAEDYRACLEGVALVGERDLEGAAAILEPLVDTKGCPCRVEAAFLLGGVRLGQALPHGMCRRGRLRRCRRGWEPDVQPQGCGVAD
jgi:hypothetical protein